MKKYVTLKCSTCARQKDQLIDLTHYAPDRCIITLGCEGRLTPVGYTSDGTAVLGIPPTGLVNWYPRGTTVTGTKAIKADVLYDTSTGSKNQIVLAASNAALGFTPSASAKITVRLNAEQQTAKDFRQYTYRRSTPFTAINGVEDNQAKKVLRYSTVGTNPDHVEVYLNGVKRDQFTDYNLNDGTVGSAVPPNTVLFTGTITGTNTQVDVVVTKATTLSTSELVFSRATNDESRTGTGAWEGVDKVQSAGIGEYSVFYCDFSEISSQFTLDVKLHYKEIVIKDTPSSAESTVPLAIMLLSRTLVHTELDRQRAKCIPFDILNSNTDYLIVKLMNNIRTLCATEASAIDLFPILDVHRFAAPKIRTAGLTGDADAAELDNILINGPDA